MFFETENHITLRGTLASSINIENAEDGDSLITFALIVPILQGKDLNAKLHVEVPCFISSETAEGFDKNLGKKSTLEISGFLVPASYSSTAFKSEKLGVCVQEYKIIQNMETPEQHKINKYEQRNQTE